MEGIAVAAQPVQQRLLREGRHVELGVRLTIGVLHRLRRTTLTAETALTAGEDRRPCGPQGIAVEILGHRFLHDDRGLALVPHLGDTGDRAALARSGDGRVHGHLLTAVDDLGEIDLDPGERDLRRLDLVEGRGDSREGGEYLRVLVPEVTQFARVGGVGPGADAEVVELDIGAAPLELLGGSSAPTATEGSMGTGASFLRHERGSIGSHGVGGFSQFLGTFVTRAVQDVEGRQITEGHRRSDGGAGPRRCDP